MATIIKGFASDWSVPTPAHTGISAVAREAVSAGMVIATQGKFPGIDPSGVTSSSAGLQSAIDNTPDGSTLIVPPGTYLLNSTVRVDGRNITISGYGATLVKGERVPMIECVGGYDDPLVVTAVGSTTITNPNGSSGPGTTLTVSGNPGWVVGAVVKVVADDAIPESRPSSSGVASRVGRFMVVHSTSTGTVTLAGELDDPFVTNVRVARLRPNSARFVGFRTRVAPALLSGLDNTPVFNFVNLVGPAVENVIVETAQGTALRFASCYKYTVRDTEVGYANDDPTVGNYGYGVQDVGCAFGRVDGYTARRVRHAFTDDSSRITTSASLTGYGRSYGAIISNSSAQAGTETAWDTHHAGEGHQFVNVTATDCRGPGVGLRGRRHVVRGLTTNRCLRGVHIFAESVGGQSWGHVVDGVTVHGASHNVVRVTLNPSGHPDAGVRESRPSRISNLVATSSTSSAVYVENASVLLSNFDIEMAVALPSTTGAIIPQNAEIRGERINLDYRQNTTGGSLKVIWTWDARTSDIHIDGMKVRCLPDHGARIARFFDTNVTTTARVVNVELDYKPGDMNAPATASLFQWRLTSGMATSALVTTSAPADVATLKGLQSAPDGVLTLQTYQTAPVVLGQLPDPLVRGQMMTVINCSTTAGATVTIYNAASGSNTRTKDGGNIVLDLNQVALFTWDSRLNAWTQLA